MPEAGSIRSHSRICEHSQCLLRRTPRRAQLVVERRAARGTSRHPHPYRLSAWASLVRAALVSVWALPCSPPRRRCRLATGKADLAAVSARHSRGRRPRKRWTHAHRYSRPSRRCCIRSLAQRGTQAAGPRQTPSTRSPSTTLRGTSSMALPPHLPGGPWT